MYDCDGLLTLGAFITDSRSCCVVSHIKNGEDVNLDSGRLTPRASLQPHHEMRSEDLGLGLCVYFVSARA
ncbi:hypothetical protein RRG08_014793 [Elysia crispata]|uniref:Uncharacterized protein n=1 Tax=Elysia crispata TaxID=231223 RepID=A0AAE1E6K3_9GAST|nr:hypothetical protein RRG08_014793 [Elysia crispata]